MSKAHSQSEPERGNMSIPFPLSSGMPKPNRGKEVSFEVQLYVIQRVPTPDGPIRLALSCAAAATSLQH